MLQIIVFKQSTIVKKMLKIKFITKIQLRLKSGNKYLRAIVRLDSAMIAIAHRSPFLYFNMALIRFKINEFKDKNKVSAKIPDAFKIVEICSVNS